MNNADVICLLSEYLGHGSVHKRLEEIRAYVKQQENSS